jgi:glycosyltransferase involved in cell wall biosynthesis
MVRKKVLYVVSKVTDSTEYELLVKYWDRERHDLEFVLLNPVEDCAVQRSVRAAGFHCTTYPYHGRRDVGRTIARLMAHFRASRPDIINCNLLEASVLGLLAAWLTGIGKRTYTRHLAAHNHKYHPIKGVLYDRFCNLLSHRIIAISQCTREVLTQWEHVPARKVVLIYHGYDLSVPVVPDNLRIAELKQKYGIGQGANGPVIGIISRPFALKGLDQTITALSGLLKRWPDANVYLFNWKPTPQSDHFDALLNELATKSVHRVYFEPDVVHLFHVFDVFIHVPEDKHAEAFGLVYTEAAMAGTPSVFTRSGIMHDVDPAQMAGLRIVPFKDADAIEKATAFWLENRPSAEERAAFARTNTEYLRGIIDIRTKMKALNALFDQL